MPNASEVRVIVLVEEVLEVAELVKGEEEEGFSATSFRKSWQQAVKGQTLPLSQLWEGINVDRILFS
ncbi:MAG: hypothetical protein WCA35_29210 [Kovacikia sp.]